MVKGVEGKGDAWWGRHMATGESTDGNLRSISEDWENGCGVDIDDLKFVLLRTFFLLYIHWYSSENLIKNVCRHFGMSVFSHCGVFTDKLNSTTITSINEQGEKTEQKEWCKYVGSLFLIVFCGNSLLMLDLSLVAVRSA